MVEQLIFYGICAVFIGVFIFVTMNIQSRLLHIISPTLNLLLALFIVLIISSIFSHVAALLPLVAQEKLTLMTSSIGVIHDLMKITLGAVITMMMPGRNNQDRDGNGNQDSLTS